MPTYDYRCDACGHVFEVFERLSSEGPRCRKKRSRRLLGGGVGPLMRRAPPGGG